MQRMDRLIVTIPKVACLTLIALKGKLPVILSIVLYKQSNSHSSF